MLYTAIPSSAFQHTTAFVETGNAELDEAVIELVQYTDVQTAFGDWQDATATMTREEMTELMRSCAGESFNEIGLDPTSATADGVIEFWIDQLPVDES